MTERWIDEFERQLADPLLFDEGVEAARNACVAGASIAAAAITAAAWYDNPLTGLPALCECMARLTAIGETEEPLGAWHAAFRPQPHPQTGDLDVSPGFGFVSSDQAAAVFCAGGQIVRVCESLAWPKLRFYLARRSELERVTAPLNAAGLAALVFVDRSVGRDEAERRYLSCRIATAIAQAQAARARGVAAFPFFSERFVYEGAYPPAAALDVAALKRQVGLG